MLDPAVFRGLIVAVIALLGYFGLEIAANLPDQIMAIYGFLSTIIAAFVIRPSVTANARVAVYVPDPIDNPDVVAPGEAVTNAPPKEIIAAAESSGP